MSEPDDPISPLAKRKRPRGRIKAPPDKMCILQDKKISPTFLIVKRVGDEGFTKVSPFFINKFITGLVGEVKNIKKLRDGSLLVETFKGPQTETLLSCKDFGGQFPIEVTPHETLNFSKGIIKVYDFQYLDIEEIKTELNNSIKNITRIKIKKNGTEIATHSYIVTFPSPIVPQTMRVGYQNVPVQAYIPNPLRCFKCLGFNHNALKCTKSPVCIQCGEARHNEGNKCEQAPNCSNCKGSHNALDRSCPIFQMYKEIKTIQINQKISLNDARKIYKDKFPNSQNQTFAQIVKEKTRKTETKEIGVQVDVPFLFGENKKDSINMEHKKVNSITSDHARGRTRSHSATPPLPTPVTPTPPHLPPPVTPTPPPSTSPAPSPTPAPALAPPIFIPHQTPKSPAEPPVLSLDKTGSAGTTSSHRNLEGDWTLVKEKRTRSRTRNTSQNRSLTKEKMETN